MKDKKKTGDEINRKVILSMVAHIFELDYKKAEVWMQTPNPNLGNVSPDQMILGGRIQRLYDFVEICRETNSEEG